MKHAGKAALDQIDDLLEQIRQHDGLKEQKRGVFYRGASAFLHFHEDPAGLFADLRGKSDWQRFPVNTPAQRRALFAQIRRVLRTT
jgi:hypothetical protein